jgi:CRP-like cAMP-binding protein
MISTEILRRYPLFAGQDQGMLKQIAKLAHEKEVKAGTWLFFDGEVAKTLYVLIEGSLDLTMDVGELGHQKIEKITPLIEGEVVGWSAMVAPHVYILGAQAIENSRLIVFDGKKLRQLLDDNPGSGYLLLKKLAEEISRRLAGKCTQLMSLMVETIDV